MQAARMIAVRISLSLTKGFLDRGVSVHMSARSLAMRAAPDTFDPKRYHPFEKGLRVADMLDAHGTLDATLFEEAL